jgi:hypothetical protein
MTTGDPRRVGGTFTASVSQLRIRIRRWKNGIEDEYETKNSY